MYSHPCNPYTKNISPNSAMGVCGRLALFWFLPSFLKYRQGKKGSQSLIPCRSGLENWCIAGGSLSWRYLQSEWQTIQSTFSHTLNLLSLLLLSYCQYQHKNSNLPGNHLLNLIFILSLVYSYTIDASFHSYVYKYSLPTIEFTVSSN